MCDNLPDIHFANFPSNERGPFAIGKEIHFDCKLGYATRPSVARIARCSLKSHVPEWTWDPSACIAKSCGDPGYMDNGQISGTLFTFGNYVELKCDEGHRLMQNGNVVRGGKFDFYCTGHVWEPRIENFSCEPIICPSLNPPPQGSITYSDPERKYSCEATYQCDEGYLLNGNSKRNCTENGHWDGTEPVCRKGVCKNPGPYLNGKIVPEKTSYNINDVIIWNCPTTGVNVSSKCQEDETWSTSAPPCGSTQINKKVGKSNAKPYLLLFIIIPILFGMLSFVFFKINGHYARPKSTNILF